MPPLGSERQRVFAAPSSPHSPRRRSIFSRTFVAFPIHVYISKELQINSSVEIYKKDPPVILIVEGTKIKIAGVTKHLVAATKFLEELVKIGRSAPRATPRPAPMRNPPQPVGQVPPPASAQGGSVLGGIGSTIDIFAIFSCKKKLICICIDEGRKKECMHQPIPGIMKSSLRTLQLQLSGANACNIHSKAFQDCINNYGRDISKCQFYLDMLNECRRGSGAVLGA